MFREFVSTVKPIPFTLFGIVCTLIVLVFYWSGILSYKLMIGYIVILVIGYVISMIFICSNECKRLEAAELLDDDECSIDDIEERYVYDSILHKKTEK